jgi:hypothetical protein
VGVGVVGVYMYSGGCGGCGDGGGGGCGGYIYV